MQVACLQNIVNTSTFKVFDTKDSVLRKSFQNHTYSADSANSYSVGGDCAFMYQAQGPVLAENKINFDDKKGQKSDGLFKKMLPAAGAAIGAILPIIILNKISGKKLDISALKTGNMLDKLKSVGEYFEIDGVKEILSTAAGAIAGGLLGGFILDKNKENRKEKVKEALFEMTNITVPTLIAAGALNLIKSKNMDKGLYKFIPFAIGLGAGIPLASKLSGTISQKIFKEDDKEQRKFHPKDFLVHIDDMVEMLVLLKVPFAKSLHIDKLLALIYAKCGHEAGSKTTENKGHGHHH